MKSSWRSQLDTFSETVNEVFLKVHGALFSCNVANTFVILNALVQHQTKSMGSLGCSLLKLVAGMMTTAFNILAPALTVFPSL